MGKFFQQDGARAGDANSCRKEHVVAGRRQYIKPMLYDSKSYSQRPTLSDFGESDWWRLLVSVQGVGVTR